MSLPKKRFLKGLAFRDIIGCITLFFAVMILIQVLRKVGFLQTYTFARFVFSIPSPIFLLFFVTTIIWITFLLFRFRKTFYRITKMFLKGLNYRYFDFIRVSKEEVCDFSPEKPITKSDEDEFGFDHLAKRLHKAIIGFNSTEPLIFGIYGRFGIGKSSLINLIKEKLINESNFVVLSFNPSYYTNIEALYKGFVYSVKNALKQITGFGIPEFHVRNWETALGITVGLSPSVKLGLKSRKEVSIEKAKDNLENWISKKNLTLIILMDDLDRCDRDEILFTLKLLRYFADFKNCFFIVGYDKNKMEKIVGMELEKFFDQEIPLEIENQVLYNWFWEKAKNCKILYDELEKIMNFAGIYNNFEEIFSDYCNTPRRVKLILNDLLIAFPVVKNKLFFPHFVIVTIMKRDMPELYNLLSSGKYWILHQGIASKLGKINGGEYNLKFEVKHIVEELYENNAENIKKAYKYLDVISGDIEYIEEIIGGKAQPEIKINTSKTEKYLIIDEEFKLIWKEGFTEAYFLWKEPSFMYPEKNFDEFFKKLKDISNGDIQKNINSEIERISDKGQVESFFKLIWKKSEEIVKRQMEDSFIIGIASVQNADDFAKEAVVTIFIFIGSEKEKENRFEKLKLAIENTSHPLMLYNLIMRANSMQSSLGSFGESFNNINKTIEDQFNRIFTRTLKCLCDFNISHEHLDFFIQWGNAEEVANYINKLKRNEQYSECGEKIEFYVRQLENSSKFFKSVIEELTNISNN